MRPKTCDTNIPDCGLVVWDEYMFLVCICIYIYMIAGSLNHQHHKTWNSHVVVCRAVVTWNSNWVLLHVFAQGAAEGAQRFHSALLGQAVAIPGNHRKPAICWKPWGLN